MGRRVVMCVAAAAVLSGCTGPGTPPPGPGECAGGAHATVTATRADGTTWRTEVPLPADRPPQVGGGYVVVLHQCGWTVLDLADGDVLRTGSGRGTVGAADGIVYSVEQLVEGDRDEGFTIKGWAVEAAPVVGSRAPGVDTGSRITYGARVWARVVDGSLYVASDDRRLTRHSASLGTRWETELPVLRDPAIVRVGRFLVVTSDDGSVYGVRARDGRALWRATVDAVDVHHLMTLRRQGTAVVVTARPGVHGPEVLTLDAASGVRLPGSPAADPKDQPLEARGEGWSVTVVSEPVPGRGN